MAYVETSPRDGESAADARRRRRVELARGWKFKCECARCLAEAVEEVEAEELGVGADEAKVESVMRHEGVKAPLGDVMGPD